MPQRKPPFLNTPPFLKLSLLTLAMALPVSLASTSYAQNAAAQQYAYEIPAGSLEQAINALGKQSGVVLIFSSDLVSNLKTSGLTGRYSQGEALDRLLKGTGLVAIPQAGGSYTIAVNKNETKTLPSVKVKADSISETAVGSLSGYLAKRSATATKTDTPILETPQSISTVTRDALDSLAAQDISDALKYTSGVSGGRDIRYDSPVLRGLGTYGQTYRDGLKEIGSQYAVPRLNVYGVERIEYMHGPSSALFGNSSPGGIVNSITKRPTDVGLHEVRLRSGNHDRVGLALDTTGALNESETVLYRLSISDEQFDLDTPQTDKRETYIAPALTFRLSADTDITLLANYQQDKTDGDAFPYSYWGDWEKYVPAFEQGWDRFDRDQWSTSVLFNHSINDNLSVHSSTRYTDTALDYRLAYANDFLSETLVERGAQYIKDESDSWQTDNYLQATWDADGWENNSLVGVDYSKADGKLLRGGNITSPYDLTTGKGVGTFVEPALTSKTLAESRQLGIYVQNQTKIHNQFVITAGLRKDDYENATADQQKVTGRLGGVWLLSAGFAPYINYSTSFEPLFGSTYDGSAFKPTTGRQVELGVRYEPEDKQVRFTAAVFDIKQQNVLTTDPVHSNFSIQTGEVGSRGLEFEANGSLSPNLNIIASYTYLDAEVTKDTDPTLVGRKRPVVPQHQINTWVDYKFTGSVLDGFSLGLGARYNTKTPNFTNDIWQPNKTLVDARIGYRIDAWEIALNAKNLLDKDYLEHCTFGTCYYGEQRNIMLSAFYRW